MDIILLVFQLFGALAIFLFGLRKLSESLQRFSNSSFQTALNYITDSPVKSYLFGFAFTNITRSSSVSTVMTVGLVNAGLLTITQVLPFVLGANLGTTSTLWLVTILGYVKVPIVTICLVLAGICLPLLFARKPSLLRIAEVIFGFSIMFIGLEYLKDIFPLLFKDKEIFELVERFGGYGILSDVIFVLIGMTITILFQSSSATTTLTLTFAVQGLIDEQTAFAIILGENIGTTSTAFIASTIANRASKQVAIFHSGINIIGTCLVLPFIPYLSVPIHDFASWLSEGLNTNAGDDYRIAISVASFHSGFNIVLTLLFMPILTTVHRVLQNIVPKTDKQSSMRIVRAGFFDKTGFEITQVYAKIYEIARLVEKMSANLQSLLFQQTDRQDRLIEKIQDREELIDEMEVEISNYLSSVGEKEMTKEAANTIRSFIEIVNELERMSDICLSISRLRKQLECATIKEDIRYELETFFNPIVLAIHFMVKAIEKKDFTQLDVVYREEQKINSMRTKLKEQYFERMENGIIPIKMGILYVSIIDEMEDLADRIVRVHEKMETIKYLHPA